MRTNIREIKYVCTPPSVSITVEYMPLQGGNQIIFFIDKRVTVKKFFRTRPSITPREMHDFTSQICNMFFHAIDEEMFANSVSPQNYLMAKYIYRTLTAVYTKAGIPIWRK